MRKMFWMLALAASVVSCGGDDAPDSMMPPPMTDGGPTPTPPPPAELGTLRLGADVLRSTIVANDADMGVFTGAFMERTYPGGTSVAVTAVNTGYVATTAQVPVEEGQVLTHTVAMGPAVDGWTYSCPGTDVASRTAHVVVDNDRNTVTIDGLMPAVRFVMHGNQGESMNGASVTFSDDHRSFEGRYIDPVTGLDRVESCTKWEG